MDAPPRGSGFGRRRKCVGSRREKGEARREAASIWAPKGAVAEAGHCVLADPLVSSQSPGPCLCAGAGALEAATGGGQLDSAPRTVAWTQVPEHPGLPPGATSSWAEAWRVGDSQSLWG